VPSTVAASAASSAITSELRAATSIASLRASFTYQAVVKPTHCALSLLSLNENTTTTASGAYRKTYAPAAQARIQTGMRRLMCGAAAARRARRVR
jgi:hypothetical protein